MFVLNKSTFTSRAVEVVKIPPPYYFWVRVACPHFQKKDKTTKYILKAINSQGKCIVHESHQFVVTITRERVVRSLWVELNIKHFN